MYSQLQTGATAVFDAIGNKYTVQAGLAVDDVISIGVAIDPQMIYWGGLNHFNKNRGKIINAKKIVRFT